MKTGLIWLETFRGDVQLSFNSKSQKINFYWCHWHTWLVGEGGSESFESFFFQPFTFFLSYLCKYLLWLPTICTHCTEEKRIGLQLILWLFVNIVLLHCCTSALLYCTAVQCNALVISVPVQSVSKSKKILQHCNALINSVAVHLQFWNSSITGLKMGVGQGQNITHALSMIDPT